MFAVAVHLGYVQFLVSQASDVACAGTVEVQEAVSRMDGALPSFLCQPLADIIFFVVEEYVYVESSDGPELACGEQHEATVDLRDMKRFRV